MTYTIIYRTLAGGNRNGGPYKYHTIKADSLGQAHLRALDWRDTLRTPINIVEIIADEVGAST